MRVLRHIDRTQYQLDFCCLSGHPGEYAEEAKALGSQVLLCPLGSNLAGFNHRFDQIVRSQDYDIIHSHVHYFSGYLLRRAARFQARGRIAHSHTTTDNKTGTVLRRLYRTQMRKWVQRFADGGVGASTEAATELFGYNWNRDRRWYVVYCGLDLQEFSQHKDGSAIRDALSIDRDTLVIASVARFSPPKNHAFLIEILSEIVRLRPNVKAVLVGEGPLQHDIRTLVQSRNLEKQVIFTGARSDVPALLSACDLLIMPSLFEGLPIAGLEAQAAGVPVLYSTNITREASVVPELTRFVSLESTASEWALEAITAKDCRLDSALISEEFTRKGFTIQASTESLTKIYQSVIQNAINK